MQVGSLVECIHTFHGHKTLRMRNSDKMIVPKKGVIYTVRAVREGNMLTTLLLEEIVNIVCSDYTGEEIGFNIDKFRLLQSPLKISITNQFKIERIIIT